MGWGGVGGVVVKPAGVLIGIVLNSSSLTFKFLVVLVFFPQFSLNDIISKVYSISGSYFYYKYSI